MAALPVLLGCAPVPAGAGMVDDCVQSADRTMQVQACTEAIESGRWADGELAWAYGNRGNAWQALRDAANAVSDYSKAIELDPDSAVSWHNRGLVFAALGDYGRAIADYDQAIAHDPEFAAAWGSRGVARRELHQYEQALDDLDQAIALEPDTARHYQNRANVRCALGDVQGSVEDRLAAIRRGHFAPDLVQRVLRDKGWYTGPVDGAFDESSVAALTRWTAAGCD